MEFKNGINFNANQKGDRGVLTIDVLNMYGESIYVNLQNLYRVRTEIKNKEDYMLKDGDILFVRSSVKREGVGWASLFKGGNEPVTFCGFIIRGRLNEVHYFPEFLTYFLRSNIARNELIVGSGYVTITNINQKLLKNLLVPIPFINGIPNLEEQKRIVARIEELFSKIDEVKKLRKSALEQAKALMPSALHQVFSKADEMGWKWVRLREISKINPSKKEISHLSDDLEVSFIPMDAVDEGKGEIVNPQIRRLGEVRKGYTYFKEGDVIFAKITPCMENGKCAIANDLMNKLGFGSTEFHVVRPTDSLLSDWIWRYLRQQSIRDQATKYFTGSVGQQRVPKEFLERLLIPLPPIEEQKRIVVYLDKIQEKAQTLQKLQEETEKEVEMLREAILYKAFRGEL
jgi:type I restriction enzyme S subunit